MIITPNRDSQRKQIKEEYIIVENIIFYMENDLISYNPKEMLKYYTNKTYESELLLNEIFQSVEWLQFDRGIIDKDTLKLKVSESVPESLKQMSIFYRMLLQTFIYLKIEFRVLINLMEYFYRHVRM